MDHETVVRVRDDVAKRCQRYIISVIEEWPDIGVDELLNALDQVKNSLVAGNALDKPDPEDDDSDILIIDDDEDEPDPPFAGRD